jgi:drug/metabolite transporter (DMT)-like permease
MRRLEPLLLPALFVLLWSTGFIGARLGMPHAEPMTFLALRFAIAAAVLAAWVVLSGAPWPDGRQLRDQLVIGALVQFVYLGGVFAAIDRGVEAGLSALIVGLQPVATALIARHVLGERLEAAQWAGMALGLAGVALVVTRKLGAGLGDPLGVLLCIAALLGIAVGSILQKTRAGDTPMRAGNAVQFAVAAVCCGAVALVAETGRVDWTGEFVLALLWLVVVLSLGAVTLLYVLIRQGAASNVASLFFLVPPCTALIAWPLFGERLGGVEATGIAATALGVLLVNRPELARRIWPARR